MPPAIPDNNYEFILKQEQKPKKSLVPSNLPGPVLIIGGVIVLMVLVIIFSAVFMGKNKTGASGLTDVIGRAQEINRINTLEQGSIKDPSVADLLTTSQVALLSEQSQFGRYASTHKIKLDPKKLAVYQNTQTDSALATAAQDNNLDGAYSAYLNQALSDYAKSLAATFDNTKDPALRAVLQAAYSSTQTLLGNPPKS